MVMAVALVKDAAGVVRGVGGVLTAFPDFWDPIELLTTRAFPTCTTGVGSLAVSKTFWAWTTGAAIAKAKRAKRLNLNSQERTKALIIVIDVFSP